jgi:hypothetical protein
MPQHRRNSYGQVVEMEHHLQQIQENVETQIEQTFTCSAPATFHCLRNGQIIHASELYDMVKLICNNDSCEQSPYMHKECFEGWQDTVLAYLKSSGRARSWSEKQRLQNLWTKKGYDLAYKACDCRCEHGHIRKDLNWVPPKANRKTQEVESESHRRRRRRNNKNAKPALTIGLPAFGLNGSQVNSVKRSDAQGIPPARARTNSVSSNTSGSSSWGSTGSMADSPPTDSPPSDNNIPPRRSLFQDRSRHDSGGSIFLRRTDYSSFNVLPKHKINSYHIKMEDECSIGNDETRCFILSSYATNKMNRVPCVLCNSSMNIFERYPLIDGTFFLSPRQHTKSCIQVKFDSRMAYLSAVCMGCLEGWTTRIHCRNCSQPWDGSQLILGTMYSYDIFAAIPCCPERLKCTACAQLVIHPEQRFNFFSDYSQTVSCPHCGIQDYHFTKPLSTYTRREDMSQCRPQPQIEPGAWGGMETLLEARIQQIHA